MSPLSCARGAVFLCRGKSWVPALSCPIPVSLCVGGVGGSSFTPPPPTAAVQRPEDAWCTLVQGGLSILY